MAAFKVCVRSFEVLFFAFVATFLPWCLSVDVAVGCASGTVKYLCLGLNLHYICPALFNLKCQTVIICSAPQRHITGEAKLYLLQFLMWLTGVLWQDSVYLVKGFRLNFLNCGFLPLFCWSYPGLQGFGHCWRGKLSTCWANLHVSSDALLLYKETASKTLQVITVKHFRSYWDKNLETAHESRLYIITNWPCQNMFFGSMRKFSTKNNQCRKINSNSAIHFVVTGSIT